MLLRDLITQFKHQQRIFSDQRYIDQTICHPKISHSSMSLTIFFFIATILMVVILIAVIALLCKHVILRTVVVGLAIQKYKDKIKGINAMETNNAQTLVWSCKVEWWTIYMLPISLVAVLGYLFLKYKQINLFRGYHYSNVSHLMPFVSDMYGYVPIKLGKASRNFRFLR